jgi:hypothetical protein
MSTGWFGRWSLRVVLLLQLVLTGFALETVRSLIDYGTQIAPRDIALSMIVAACHAVALVASFGRADQMAWRMYVLMGCQVTAAFLLIWGLMGDSFAGAGPLPRSEWGSGLVLGMIRLSQGLSLLLTPVPMVIAAIHAARSPEPAHRVPMHVVAALVVAGASLGVVLPWYTTRFEARHQPDVLVRQLLADPRMRSYARTALINMSAAERDKARPALIQALNRPDPEVQLAAASVLAVTEADTALVVARLIDLLDTPFQQRDFAGTRTPPSAEAAQVLATMGPKAAPAVPALMERIRQPPTNGPERVVVVAAVRALGRIGGPAKSAVPLLLVQVREGNNSFVQEQAAFAVDQLDPVLARRCTGTALTLAEATRQAATLRREPVPLKAECAEIQERVRAP